MIKYEFAIPDQDQLFQLYEKDGWNEFLKLPKEKLHQAMKQSWLVIGAFDRECLIGTGRIISDGVINAYLCGLIVDPAYRSQGIGKEMVRRLAEECSKARLHVQLMAEEEKAGYYEKLDFEVFTLGLKYKFSG
ncbi:acetyltransferase (GNAT) family protein [Cytobacillus firmus]|uniref:Acetyltransferase (GNAT) family protein n=2 Tax=Cytobacillus TaxID=2675230 RepID=A0A366JWN3_CYTFI|nr:MULTISPECIES: GNAT family N-acetyltransferase [Cytobacillus]RBP93021.1 acetyltransferase (GNAT) family protein [Cytobacillus firmus]TDX42623.1 acetyltransferase (GNAT) family protein [Cytobacillus oceanisediminis]